MVTFQNQVLVSVFFISFQRQIWNQAEAKELAGNETQIQGCTVNEGGIKSLSQLFIGIQRQKK